MAGWAYSVRRNVSSPSASKMTSSNGFSSTSATAAAHRVTVSANTGSVSNNSRAMPANWLPCPGNNHAVFGGVSASTPRTRPGAGRSSASASSSSLADSLESTTNAARCSKWVRPTPAVKHTSDNVASGCALNQSRYFSAVCTNAAGLRAESGSTLNRRSSAAPPPHRLLCGASSRMTCALVPGEPERTDSRNTGPIVAFPCGGLVDDPHRKPVPGNVGRRILKVQVLRQYLVLERQDDLDDTRDPGGRFQVPDVRLHRSDQQRPAGVAPVAEHRSRGLDFDRIAKRCPGPVRLQVSDVAGCDTGALAAPRR